jgi:hypothetical protein
MRLANSFSAPPMVQRKGLPLRLEQFISGSALDFHFF